MTKSPTSDISESSTLEKASQAEFDHEVKRMQSLITHVQLRASQLEKADGAPNEVTRKIEEVADLLEQAEVLLEEVKELRE